MPRLLPVLLLAAACVPRVEPSPDGGGLDASLPDRCPPGQMLFPGETSCQPGEWSACSPGLVPAVSGWGCAPVVAASPCAGATRETLGTTDCVPVGDCGRSPPAGTALFVDASLSPAQQDATHYRSLAAAVAAAPPNAVLFVRPGTYAEPLTLRRPVYLVGQCPALVTLQAPRTVGVPGVRIETTGVALSGFTVRGGFVGVSVGANGGADVSDCVLEDNGAIGLALSDVASSATLSTSVVRHTTPMGSAPGWGVSVQAGSRLTLTEVAVVDNVASGVRVSGTGSAVVATALVVRGTHGTSGLDYGRGVVVQRGAFLSLSRAAVLDSVEVGVLVALDATATLEGVVVSGTKANSLGQFGRALNVSDGSRLTLRASTLSGNRDASLMVVGSGAVAELDRCVIVDTALSADGLAGRGITVQEEAGLTLRRSAVVGSHEVGVVVVDLGRALLERSLVAGTGPNALGQFGIGLVGGGDVEVRVVASQLAGNATIGLGVGPGSFVVEDATLSGNAVGLFVDDAVTLLETTAAPDAGLNQAVITRSTRFIGNAARTGNGALPLPQALAR